MARFNENWCQKCGRGFFLEYDQPGPAPMYCPDCKRRVQRDQTRERVRRFRERQKESATQSETAITEVRFQQPRESLWERITTPAWLREFRQSIIIERSF